MSNNWGASLTGATALSAGLRKVSAQIDAKGVTYVVGTPVEYSVYVELGTSRMAAQPYLRPAVERVARNIQSYLDGADTLADAIAAIALAIEAEAKRLCPVDTGQLRASISAERQK